MDGKYDITSPVSVIRRPTRGRGNTFRYMIRYAPENGKVVYLPLQAFRDFREASEKLKKNKLTRAKDLLEKVPEGVFVEPKLNVSDDFEGDII